MSFLRSERTDLLTPLPPAADDLVIDEIEAAPDAAASVTACAAVRHAPARPPTFPAGTPSLARPLVEPFLWPLYTRAAQREDDIQSICNSDAPTKIPTLAGSLPA